MEDNMNNHIERALKSLDGIEKASPRDFFFTRLEGRMMASKSVWENISTYLSRPIIAICSICLVLALNFWVLFSAPSSSGVPDGGRTELATVDEYNQLNSNFLEFVNMKP